MTYKRLIVFLNYLSLSWLLAFLYAFVYTFFTIGKLPEFSRPDPSQAVPYFEVVFEVFHINNILLVICIWLSTIYIIFLGREKSIFISIFVLLIGIVLKLVAIYFDPLGLFDWFMD